MSNNCCLLRFTLNYLHVKTRMLTDVQTPFLGTPISSPSTKVLLPDPDVEGLEVCLKEAPQRLRK